MADYIQAGVTKIISDDFNFGLFNRPKYLQYSIKLLLLFTPKLLVSLM